MSNQGGKARGKGKVIYPDDRTKTVRIIDNIAKIIAVILSMLVLVNTNSLLKGGGYEDSKVVPTFGFSNSRVETSYMKPEVPDKSVVVAQIASSYAEGDVVQYFDGERNPVGRVTKVDGEKITISRESADDPQGTITVEKPAVCGKVVFHTQKLYGFFGWYHTALGAVTTVAIVLFLLCLGDLLMIKKRREALEKKRAAQAKKEAMKLKNRMNSLNKTGSLSGAGSANGAERSGNSGSIEDKAAERKAKKEEKIAQDRKIVEEDMQVLREKMKEEEKEFYDKREDR